MGIQIWSAVACHRFKKREQAPALQKIVDVEPGVYDFFTFGLGHGMR